MKVVTSSHREKRTARESVYTGEDPFLGQDRGFVTNATLLKGVAVAHEHPVPFDLGAFDGALAVLHLHGVTDDHGSAVILAPGLAVTAYHVVERYVPLIARGWRGLLCAAPRRVGMDLWQVEAVTAVEQHDVAYLTISLASSVPDEWSLSIGSVTTRTPREGDLLGVVGFSLRWHQGEWHGNPSIAAGVVRAVHPTGRDRLLSPGPCIEIECGVLGGMSGGPVFDVDGRLLGIVHRGWGDGGSPMVASWLPFTLFTAVPLVWPRDRYPAAPLPVIEVLPGGVHGQERIRLSSSGFITYLPWHDEKVLEQDPGLVWAAYERDPSGWCAESE